MLGHYEDIAEHRKREEVLKELEIISKKLNITFYEVEYTMNELKVTDCLDKDELIFN